MAGLNIAAHLQHRMRLCLCCQIEGHGVSQSRLLLSCYRQMRLYCHDTVDGMISLMGMNKHQLCAGRLGAVTERLERLMDLVASAKVPEAPFSGRSAADSILSPAGN